MTQIKTVIIDNGTGSTKAGFGGEDTPRHVFPTIVGYPKEGNKFIGDQLSKSKTKLKLVFPIKRRGITEWQELEDLWDYTFKQKLEVEPENARLFLTEPPLETNENREKKCQVLFETFGINSLALNIQPVLSLYSFSKQNGVVLEIGKSYSSTCCVFQGTVIPQTINRLHLGGKDITKYLIKLLNGEKNEEKQLTLEKDWDLIRSIKEKMCFVSKNPSTEEKRSSLNQLTKTFESNNSTFTLSKNRYLATEILFKPQLINLNNEPNITSLITKSVGQCDERIQNEIYHSIVITGGSSRFKGLKERVEKELKTLLGNRSFNVIFPVDTLISAWVGASMLSVAQNFQESWFTKEQYNEIGVKEVHKRFYHQF
ncbi:actin-5c-related [Anaeramoeba flamelloides]|uniref:Actin-5c-related n=1 Tax=Anaeramoeba flamelloides TaxID=1746091 RepID=A0AAV7ZK16_9EUKA|nr:actin-5c-related [Anaeramoeba flamelloides]KAJ6228370.1 actin-5c-related [Anaeramoeba flamelloides]|eukprot:Anaeramoba_flamelloidesa567326_163.p1 GENE.a567326_163~~a567326_163.p1  ORF type:complete len:377 (-),score=76.26 a567326_163:62-1171(-)